MTRVAIPRHFPVRHAIGVDISDVSVELLELEPSRQQTQTVMSYAHADLPLGVVRDGEILDPARLAHVLTATYRGARPQPFRTRWAVISLPESKVYLRAFDFPRQLTEEQVRRATPYEAEGALPLTLDEVYYDIVFHRSRVDTHHVLFAAAPRRIVDAAVAVFQRTPLLPIAFDVESAALALSIVGARMDPVLVADIGGRATVVSVIEREAVHTSVTIPVAGDAFTEKIAGALGLARDDAEQQKRKSGLEENAPPALREALASAFTPLLQELRRTAEYHEAHTGRAVRDLLLAGGSAQMPGMVEFLAGRTGLHVAVGDPWQTRNVRVPAAVPETERLRLAETRAAFATVVGLALRGVRGEPAAQGINLLPPVLRAPHRVWRRVLTTTICSLLAAITTLALASVVAAVALSRGVELRRVTRAALEVRAELLGAPFQQAVRDADAANAELAILQAFTRDRTEPGALLAGVRAVLPDGIALHVVEVTVPPDVAQSLRLRLQGIADRRETFLVLEQRLRSLEGQTAFDSPLSNLDQPVAAPFTVAVELRRPLRVPAEGRLP